MEEERRETYLQRVKVCVGRLSSRHLDCGDSQTPNISFEIVSTLFDHFRRHCSSTEVSNCLSESTDSPSHSSTLDQEMKSAVASWFGQRKGLTSTNKGILLRHRCGELTRYSEISQLDFSISAQQYIRRYNTEQISSSRLKSTKRLHNVPLISL